MDEMKDVVDAKIEFNKLMNVLRQLELPYDFIPEHIGVAYGLPCNGVSAAFQILFIPENKIVRLTAVTPVLFPTLHFEKGAEAVARINFNLTDGHFDLEPRTGRLTYAMSLYYGGCTTSEELYERLMSIPAKNIATYGEKLLKLSIGKISVEEIFD